MIGAVIFSAMIHDSPVTVWDWIVDSRWSWNRRKTQVVEFVKVLQTSSATHLCLYKLYAVCEVLISKLFLSRCCAFSFVFVFLLSYFGCLSLS